MIPKPFNTESQSPYVFVFRNPRKIMIPIKMRGNPNIYDVNNEIIYRVFRSL